MPIAATRRQVEDAAGTPAALSRRAVPAMRSNLPVANGDEHLEIGTWCDVRQFVEAALDLADRAGTE